MGDPLMVALFWVSLLPSTTRWQHAVAEEGASQDNGLHGILGLVEGLTFHYHSMQTTQPNRWLLSLGRMSRRWRKR